MSDVAIVALLNRPNIFFPPKIQGCRTLVNVLRKGHTTF